MKYEAIKKTALTFLALLWTILLCGIVVSIFSERSWYDSSHGMLFTLLTQIAMMAICVFIISRIMRVLRK